MSEQILSAMRKPSDVVVSAVLVNSPSVDSEQPPETSQIDQGYVAQAPQGDAYFFASGTGISFGESENCMERWRWKNVPIARRTFRAYSSPGIPKHSVGGRIGKLSGLLRTS